MTLECEYCGSVFEAEDYEKGRRYCDPWCRYRAGRKTPPDMSREEWEEAELDKEERRAIEKAKKLANSPAATTMPNIKKLAGVQAESKLISIALKRKSLAKRQQKGVRGMTESEYPEVAEAVVRTKSFVIKARDKEIVAEITKLHREIGGTLRVTLKKAIRIGELLTEQKATTAHGEWLPWIEQRLPFTYRTASRYMRAYGNRAKLDSVSNLTEAYRMLTTEPGGSVEGSGGPSPQTPAEKAPEDEQQTKKLESDFKRMGTATRRLTADIVKFVEDLERQNRIGISGLRPLIMKSNTRNLLRTLRRLFEYFGIQEVGPHVTQSDPGATEQPDALKALGNYTKDLEMMAAGMEEIVENWEHIPLQAGQRYIAAFQAFVEVHRAFMNAKDGAAKGVLQDQELAEPRRV